MPLNTAIEKQTLIDFMLNTTLEVTPLGADKVSDLRHILRPGCTVYVTFLPGSDFADTLRTVRRLKHEGYSPVPHFAARSIASAKVLEENLAALQGETGITEGLLVGGGLNTPVGEFDSSIQVLRTGLFEKYGFTKLGFAGHPEGNPDIPDAQCNLAIKEKNDYAKNTDMDCYLATQFVFEASPVLAWEKKIRDQGNCLPIYVGIPGLASVKTLLHHAQQCGIGPSVHFLTRNPINMLRLSLKDSFLGRFVAAPASEPSQLLHDLVAGKLGDPDSLIERCHLYPLGGLEKSARWMYRLQDGNFEFAANGLRII